MTSAVSFRIMKSLMSEDLEPTSQDLPRPACSLRSQVPSPQGARLGAENAPRLWLLHADDYYEALLAKPINAGCLGADIGCGRDLFPSNPALAAQRCLVRFGVNPDDHIKGNPYLTGSFQGTLEACSPAHQFDVVTLRMVAEHITDPLMWGTEPPDTFPTVYRLNTRRDLLRHFSKAGFVEVLFRKLDDCRIFNRYRLLNFLELTVRGAFRLTGLPYPETCLLAVFRKVQGQSEAGAKDASGASLAP